MSSSNNFINIISYQNSDINIFVTNEIHYIRD